MPFIVDDAWTPSAYRKAFAAWSAQAPANDSDVMPAPRKANPRHSATAARLKPLLAFRDPPSGSTLRTNWSTMPANDNRPPLDFHTEKGQEISPSEDEIMRALQPIYFYERREARQRAGEFTHVPAGRIDRPFGDVEWGEDIDGKKVVVRMASLCFSNGRHTERAYRRAVGGGVEAYAARLPVGALRFTSERQTGTLGPQHQAHTRAANLRVAGTFGFDELYEPIPTTRQKKRGPRVSKAEERRWLVDAIVNTPVMPDVRKCPDGLPTGTKDIASLFMSLNRAPKGRGDTPWEDFATRMDSASAFQHILDELPQDTVDVLEAAMTANSMAEIGAIAGASVTYAERAGRKALEAANDDLAYAMKKIRSVA